MLIHFDHIKNGKEPLVLIHGLRSSKETFDSVKNILSDKYELIIVDQNGHGDSPPIGLDFSAKKMASDIVDVLKHLNITAAHILGHSMGGRTAMALVEFFPQYVKSLIVEDMSITPRKTPDESVMENAKACIVNQLTFKTKEEICDLLNKYFWNAKELIKYKIKKNKDDTYSLLFWPHVSLLYVYQGNLTDFTPPLQKSNIPMLFLVADFERDSVLNIEDFNHIKNNLPHAKIVQILKSGHSIHKTHPQEFCEEIFKFHQ